MSGKLKKFGQLLAGGFLVEKVEEFFGSVIQAGASLKTTSERLGVTTDELQRFRLAAQLSGASAEAADVGIRFLNRSIGEAAHNGGKLAGLIDLKDSAGQIRPTAEILGDLADKLKEAKSQGERTALAMKVLGRGGSQLLPMLQGGKEEFQEFFGAVDEYGGGITEDFAEKAHQAHAAVIKWQFAMESLKTSFASTFLPVITSTLARLGHWVAAVVRIGKQTNVLKTALIALLAGPAIGYFRKLLVMYKEWRKESELNWRDLVKIGLKWIVIAAAAAAAYLIFDDLYGLWTGGDSTIGKLIDRMYGFGTAAKVVQDVKQWWAELMGIVEPAIPAIEQMGAALLKAFANALPYAIKLVVIVGALLSSGIHAVTATAKSIGESIADMLNGDPNKIFGGAGANWQRNFKDVGKVEGQLIQQTWNAQTPTFQQAPGEQGPGVINVGRITFNNENNISGVSDPKKVGGHVAAATRGSIDNSKLRAAFAAARIGG